MGILRGYEDQVTEENVVIEPQGNVTEIHPLIDKEVDDVEQIQPAIIDVNVTGA